MNDKISFWHDLIIRGGGGCVQINDISLADYIAVSVDKHATFVPHTAGRYSVKRFRKAQCPIVERLTNSLMMHGRNNGKKLMAVRIVKHAMEIIHLLTDQNPIQVIVDAIINRWVLSKFHEVARETFECLGVCVLWSWERFLGIIWYNARVLK